MLKIINFLVIGFSHINQLFAQNVSKLDQRTFESLEELFPNSLGQVIQKIANDYEQFEKFYTAFEGDANFLSEFFKIHEYSSGCLVRKHNTNFNPRNDKHLKYYEQNYIYKNHSSSYRMPFIEQNAFLSHLLNKQAAEFPENDYDFSKFYLNYANSLEQEKISFINNIKLTTLRKNYEINFGILYRNIQTSLDKITNESAKLNGKVNFIFDFLNDCFSYFKYKNSATLLKEKKIVLTKINEILQFICTEESIGNKVNIRNPQHYISLINDLNLLTVILEYASFIALNRFSALSTYTYSYIDFEELKATVHDNIINEYNKGFTIKKYVEKLNNIKFTNIIKERLVELNKIKDTLVERMKIAALASMYTFKFNQDLTNTFKIDSKVMEKMKNLKNENLIKENKSNYLSSIYSYLFGKQSNNRNYFIDFNTKFEKDILLFENLVDFCIFDEIFYNSDDYSCYCSFDERKKFNDELNNKNDCRSRLFKKELCYELFKNIYLNMNRLDIDSKSFESLNCLYLNFVKLCKVLFVKFRQFKDIHFDTDAKKLAKINLRKRDSDLYKDINEINEKYKFHFINLVKVIVGKTNINEHKDIQLLQIITSDLLLINSLFSIFANFFVPNNVENVQIPILKFKDELDFLQNLTNSESNIENVKNILAKIKNNNFIIANVLFKENYFKIDSLFTNLSDCLNRIVYINTSEEFQTILYNSKLENDVKNILKFIDQIAYEIDDFNLRTKTFIELNNSNNNLLENDNIHYKFMIYKKSKEFLTTHEQVNINLQACRAYLDSHVLSWQWLGKIQLQRVDSMFNSKDDVISYLDKLENEINSNFIKQIEQLFSEFKNNNTIQENISQISVEEVENENFKFLFKFYKEYLDKAKDSNIFKSEMGSRNESENNHNLNTRSNFIDKFISSIEEVNKEYEIFIKECSREEDTNVKQICKDILNDAEELKKNIE